MRSILRCLLIAGSLSALPAAGDSGPAREIGMPIGIAIRMTLEGPVFVGANGRTLYVPRAALSGGAFDGCLPGGKVAELEAGPEGQLDVPVYPPDASSRRSCLDKHPPLLAIEGATPFGKWTLRT